MERSSCTWDAPGMHGTLKLYLVQFCGGQELCGSVPPRSWQLVGTFRVAEGPEVGKLDLGNEMYPVWIKY